MHYYRFRPYSELSLKELLYSEMYFTSPEECNDPFDSKSHFVLKPIQSSWRRAIDIAMPTVASNEFKDMLADHLCNGGEMAYEELLYSDLFNDFELAKKWENKRYRFFQNQLKEYIKNRMLPTPSYFVSFSRANNDPLMWSHYADKHNGFCLIFRPKNSCILQHSLLKKKNIGIKPMPIEFELTKIDYRDEIKTVDSFSYMFLRDSKDYDTKEKLSELEKLFNEHYFQKGEVWNYEKEYRIKLPIFHLPELEKLTISQQHRLFHYEPRQLVGIIYGARMTTNEIFRIRQLLSQRRQWIAQTNDEHQLGYSLCEFRALTIRDKRELCISPSVITMSDGSKFSVGDEGFEEIYDKLGYKEVEQSPIYEKQSN